ncbi:hypothetical protein [Ralstonia sp.]|uniref:hypothetical protein n=1 Tax=Ralstonia sp. TaxID=54061 RepID=UPI00397E18B4
MTRTDFIRHYVLRWFDRHTQEPGVKRLIYEAGRLWDYLNRNGVGERQAHQPRDITDWYATLSAEQRALFDRFWSNSSFAYKRGRNGAAMRWAQLNPDATTAEHIIHAAGLEAEARKRLPRDQTPIMAQGWLAERRWEDYAPPQAQQREQAHDANRAERRRLRAEISHLDRLLSHQENEQLREQRDELAGRIAVLEQEDG